MIPRADPSKAMLRYIFILILGLTLGVCYAEPLWENSAFMPDVRSHFQPSLLSENDTYVDTEPYVPQDGLFQSFQSWKSFSGSLVEIFTARQAKHAFFQYAYRDSSIDYTAEANFYTGYEHRLDDPGSYGMTYMGMRMNSQLNERFKMRANWWSSATYFDLEAAQGSPLIDGFYNLGQYRLWLDNVSGSLSYNTKHFTAALGRGKFQIGNSISGSIILSDRVNDYDFILSEEKLGKVRFSSLHGFLMADSTSTAAGLRRYPEKYVALHQISYQPENWLELYFGENVIYGNRSIDLSYLLPTFFWRITKHNDFDNDNLLLYGGINVTPNPDLTIYLNGAVDELTVFKMFSNWWGNKYAIQTGASLQLPSLAKTPGLVPRVGLEFTAIRPWTYTHYVNHAMYSHDQHPLGYPKGANLLDLSSELNFPLSRRMTWNSQASLTWQGSVGNDWRLNYTDYYPAAVVNTAQADWLEGDVTFSCVWQNTLQVEVMGHHTLLLGHSSDFSGAPRHKLFGNWQIHF